MTELAIFLVTIFSFVLGVVFGIQWTAPQRAKLRINMKLAERQRDDAIRTAERVRIDAANARQTYYNKEGKPSKVDLRMMRDYNRGRTGGPTSILPSRKYDEVHIAVQSP